MASLPYIEIFTRLMVAALLGAAIGLERAYRHKPAGVRTDVLVAVGTAAMTIVSVEIARVAAEASSIDISRIVSQILPGIGFIGAGTIIHAKGRVEGLTTAASIWLVAGVSMAVGLGMFGLGVMATMIGIMSLIILHLIHIPETENGKKQ